MNQQDISWLATGIGCLLMLIPILIFRFYKTGLVRATLIATARMILQLFLVGLYLEVIFEFDSPAVNLLWVIIMIVAAGFTIISRSELSKKRMFLPILIAIITNVLINGIIYAVFIIGSEAMFSARYLIPIMGMVIGNTVNSTIIALRNFFLSLKENEESYFYLLLCGASKDQAVFSFIRDALKEAFNPVIASTATIGLIWLPGMMTGQILGGSDPTTAIKYQIMIVISIFAGGVITVFTALMASKKFAFTQRDTINKKIFS